MPLMLRFVSRLLPRGSRPSMLQLVAGLLACASAYPAAADPGTLDASFGVGGVATLRVPSPSGSIRFDIRDVRELPDGRMLVSGTCGQFPDSQLCVGRVTPTGTIDASFGVNGFASALPPASGVWWASGGGMAIERDGRITVAGSCGGSVDARLCYARFSPSGSLLDTGERAFAGSPAYGLIALRDSEGRRVLVAECGFAFCLLRLRADGAPDPDFGTGGAVVLTSGTDYFKPTAIVEGLNGELYLSATCVPSAGSFRACVVAVTAWGSLNASFGAGGRAMMPSTDDSTGQALAMEADGSLALAGVCRVSPTERRVCMSRLSPDGVFLNTLGPGVVIHAVTSGDHARAALAVLPDGRSVLAANCRDSGATSYDLCALRLKQNGTFDATFGTLRSGRNRFDFLPGFDESIEIVRIRRSGASLLAANWGGTGRIVQLRGGPHGAPQCALDLDGDGVVASTTDVQILARVLMGLTGDAVLAGLALAPHATRGTWPELRRFLTRHCGLRLP